MILVEVPCPLCNSRRVRVSERYTRWRNVMPPCKISECIDCRMVFLSPRPSEDDYAAFYATDGGSLSKILDSAFYIEEGEKRQGQFSAILLQIVRDCSHLRAGRRVSMLDVGCSTGLFVKAASDSGFDCVGLEPSKEAASIALAAWHQGNPVHDR